MKEPDFKELIKGRTVYLPPCFMTCNQAIDELLEVEDVKTIEPERAPPSFGNTLNVKTHVSAGFFSNLVGTPAMNLEDLYSTIPLLSSGIEK